MVPEAVDAVVDSEVDARDLRCPMPLLKAKQALNRLQVGQTLRVIATDPASLRDFQSWGAQGGQRLLSFAEQGNVFFYILRKGNE